MQGTRLGIGDIAARALPSREARTRDRGACCERPVRLRAARSMPPVISTIVMLRLFARRQHTSMSAYFTNSLTPPTSLGLLASPSRQVPFRSSSAWLGRSQKDGLPSCRGEHGFYRFKAINSRTGEGQPGRCPFLIRSGNGRQDAQACFAHRPVAVLRRRRLDFGSPCFGFGLFCARGSCRSRRRTLAYGHHQDRTPHGYEATREAAMAAFAKSWRRE